MLKQMKKTLGILLVVCFLMSVTAAAVSAESVLVKEKKNVTTFMKDAKTKFFKHHHHKNMNMNGGKGKDKTMKTEIGKNSPIKTENGKDKITKTETGKNIPIKTEKGNDKIVKP
jgi:hypothetical protein